MRVYRRRFLEVIQGTSERFEIPTSEIFDSPPEHDIVAIIIREVEDFLCTLAAWRPVFESDASITVPWPQIDAWERYEPLLTSGNDAMAQQVYPKLREFYDKFEELNLLFQQGGGEVGARASAMITRLDMLGTQAIWAFEDARNAEPLQAARRDVQASLTVSAAGRAEPALQMTSVELSNIRCFEYLKLDLASASRPSDWVLVVGDNARGKSTLLRSIAMGLCNEADAAALLKKIPGRMLRGDAREGHIKITLANHDGKTYTIRTDIKLEADANVEILRRRTSPESGFPWNRIFVCAYGTQRTRHAQQSYERYAALDAVRSLFDYDADLQNPEIILSRQPPAARLRMEQKLLQILMLEDEHGGIDYSAGGIELSGPWGRLPLGSLSDGYRSTFQWVLDLIGWLIYAGRFEHDADMAGVVLIDELEQHLHPRWQRYIIAQIHRQFPGIQFIASTHTPLVAAGLADIDNATLIKLDEDENGATTASLIDPGTLRGQRADQVLTSPAFGLVTSRSPGSTDDLARYTELAAKERTPDEEDEFQELTGRLEASLSFGETPFEQMVEQAVRQTLDGLLGEPPSKAAEFELKKQLRALVRGGEAP